MTIQNTAKQIEDLFGQHMDGLITLDERTYRVLDILEQASGTPKADAMKKEALEILEGVLKGYNPYELSDYLAHSLAGSWPRLMLQTEDSAGDEWVQVPVEFLEQLMPFLREAAGLEYIPQISTMTEAEFMGFNFGGDVSDHQVHIDKAAKERAANAKPKLVN